MQSVKDLFEWMYLLRPRDKEPRKPRFERERRPRKEVMKEASIKRVVLFVIKKVTFKLGLSTLPHQPPSQVQTKSPFLVPLSQP